MTLRGMDAPCLNVRHLTKFVGEVWRRRPMETPIHRDCTLNSDPLRSFQRMELVQERSDVVELWRREDEPSGGVQHWLEPWQETWWNAPTSVALVQDDWHEHRVIENTMTWGCTLITAIHRYTPREAAKTSRKKFSADRMQIRSTATPVKKVQQTWSRLCGLSFVDQEQRLPKAVGFLTRVQIGIYVLLLCCKNNNLKVWK